MPTEHDGAPPTLFAFGMGYTVKALAKALTSHGGYTVLGTSRSLQKPNPHKQIKFDGTSPLPPGTLSGMTHVISSIPPGSDGDPALKHHIHDLIETKPKWVAYLSTTGVYGDTRGAWVDETSPTAPTKVRSENRAAAERRWLSLYEDHGVPVHVFRLAGIYGPGRSPLTRVKAGRAKRIDLPGHLSSRIHVDDIVSVLLASMARPNPGAIYNVADDEPAAPEAVTAFAATLLGLPPPPLLSLEDANLSPMAKSFYADRRRVDNRRIKEELGVELRYPTYREGLMSLAGGAS